MKKNFFIILILSLLCILPGCRKAAFSLKFDLPSDVSGTFRAVYYASNKQGGLIIENVAVVTRGKGELKCPDALPTVLFLYPSSGNALPLPIYAERGNEITISGTSESPYSWKIGGNKVNEAMSEWRNENLKILEKGDPSEINKAVAKYVTENPASPISSFMLLTTFNRSVDETAFRRLWQGLQGEAREANFDKIISRADLIDGYVRTPGKLKELVLRSLQNGVDTIRPEKAKATLLYFWTTNQTDRREAIDTLRRFSREFPDSASRIIADICIDPDSLSWRSGLRFDSLENVARLWAPAGLADSRLMGLGVPRAPFFIVISPDGNQRYRGTSSSEAFTKFRSLAK